ncbi:MAG: hypothetical protein R3315_13735, partial [Woeseiaceae bacterium]|nr:hypothetical protein [Woeseiaceae bacterium]
MTRRGVTWLLAILLAIPLVAIGLFGLLAGTEAGTRWLARMAEPYLPEPLEITTPSGTLLGGVRIATLRWQDERRSVEARSVELNLELVPLIDREIRLTALEASSLDVRIMPEESPAPFDGSLPQIELPLRLHLESVRIDNVALDLPGFQREIDRIEASLDANRDRIRIDELRVASSWLDLNLRGRLWTTGRYRADLSADWRYVLSDDRILAGRLSIDGDADALAVDHRLNEPYAVSSSGVIDTLITAPAFDLIHRWESITLSAGERTVTSTDGRLATRGAADDLAVELSTSIAVEGLPEAATELVGRTDWRSLDIESLLLDSDAGKAALAGAISWADGIRFDTAFEFSDVDAAQLTDRVHGRIGIDGSADGRYVDNALRLDATIDALSGELNDWPLSGSAGVSYDDGSIELADAALALGDNRLTLNGSIAERLDLTAGLALASASVIDPRASGSLQVDAMIRGEAQNPAVNARIRGDGLSFSGIRAERLEGTVAVTEQRSVDAALDLARVGTEEFVVETGAIRVDGNFESHDIDIQLTDDAERLRVTATGSLAEEAWRARIDALDIDTRVLDAWSLEQPAALEFAADSVSLGTLCLASASTGGRLCAEGRYRAQASYALLEMRRLPLAALPIRLPAGAGIEGFVESDVDLRLEGEELRGAGVMRLVDAVMVATYEDEPYELRVSEAFVNANIENSRLVSSLSVVFNDGGGEASASLEIDDLLRTDSSIRGSGRLGIPDASIAGVFLPDLSGPTGRIDGDLAVTGSLAAPDFSGEIRLEDASFGVRPAGIRITDLNLRLSQLDAGRLQVDGSARSGEGEVSIRGATRVNAEEGLRA